MQVALLSRIHHRNLVPLIGYCEEADRRILVYEYMHNGTLGDHLYGFYQFSRYFSCLSLAFHFVNDS